MPNFVVTYKGTGDQLAVGRELCKTHAVVVQEGFIFIVNAAEAPVLDAELWAVEPYSEQYDEIGDW